MSLPRPIDLQAYASGLFLSALTRPAIAPAPAPAPAAPRCADCGQAEAGYRGSECCAGCYRDRYAESPDERGGRDE